MNVSPSRKGFGVAGLRIFEPVDQELGEECVQERFGGHADELGVLAMAAALRGVSVSLGCGGIREFYQARLALECAQVAPEN